MTKVHKENLVLKAHLAARGELDNLVVQEGLGTRESKAYLDSLDPLAVMVSQDS